MGTNDRAVQQQPFQIGIAKLLEDSPPNPLARPAIKAPPDGVPIAEPLRQITPRSASLGDPKNRIEKPTVVCRCHAGLTFPTRQKILDPFLIRCEAVSWPSLRGHLRSRALGSKDSSATEPYCDRSPINVLTSVQNSAKRGRSVVANFLRNSSSRMPARSGSLSH